MGFDENLNAYFVNTSDNVNEDMCRALLCLKEHLPEQQIRELRASECFPLIASGSLTKKDVFVLDTFEDEFFEQLQRTKALIIGPRCLIRCLENDIPIPQGTSPVFTIAMRNLKISATGITSAEKEKMRQLIHWMGGHYFQHFGLGITHLVSNTIKSTKYEHATLNGIPVMHVDWIKRVWDRSCNADVNAVDAEFEKYALPTFFGINVTCTGLDSDKKTKVMELVNNNGGTYHRAFRSQLVDIVVTEKDCTSSEKFQAAVRYKKDTLLPEWIFDSVEKGFALPLKKYRVNALKVSTPTKNDQSIANFTTTGTNDISRISVMHSAKCINDTVNDTNISHAVDTPTNSTKASNVKSLHREVLHNAGDRYRVIYDEICPTQAKKAGTFLDGCCIYLSGFRVDEREKLNRILNAGGATRYDVVNEKITHIIVGKINDAEFRTWQQSGLLTGINVVRLDWLLESIKLKQPASENIYRVSIPNPNREPDTPSPSSKRTLRSMNHSFKQPDKPVRKKLFEQNQIQDTISPLASSTALPAEHEENHIIAQYTQDNHAVISLPPSVAVAANKSIKSSTFNNNSTIMQPGATSTQIGESPAVALKLPAMPQNATAMTDCNDATNTIDYENLNFFQGMTLYVEKEHFPDTFYTQIVCECEAAQGLVVAETFRDPVDYAIVSFEKTLNASKIPVKARHIITELYVESCLKENRIVPIEYYHKHIPHTADAQPLTNMTVVISTYTGLERDFIDSLAQCLGARVNKSFVKKERALLVCSSPEGSKYLGAIKWRYPIVNSQYLCQCAIMGKKLPYKLFLVGDSPEDFPMPVECMQPADIIENLPPENMAAKELFTPLRNKRVSQLAGYAEITPNIPNAATESPHTPINNNALPYPAYNFEVMEQMATEIEDPVERECIRDLIAEMRNNQTPELERIRRQAYTPINRKLPTPKGIPDFCTTPEFERRMVDEFEKRWKLPIKKIKPDTPIDVIRRRMIIENCKAMGFVVDEDALIPVTVANTTPTMPQKTLANETTRMELPSTSHKTLVNETTRMELPSTSHKTLANETTRMELATTAVNETGGRASDAFIPATQSPGTSSTMCAKNATLDKSTINFDKINFEDTEISDGDKSDNAMSSSAAELQKITDYLKNCATKRQSLIQQSVNEKQKRLLTETETETQAGFVAPFESEKFMGTQQLVDWQDPVEYGKSKRATSVHIPSMQYQGTPRFSISCSDVVKLEDIKSKIIKLGGTISDNLVNYDTACTHILCNRPNRGEKIMGGIAAGRWLLSLNYIEECFARDVFINEELYEWENDKALNLPQLTSDEAIVAKAATNWRQKLSGKTKAGAFKGFNAILRIAERKYNPLKNVIMAGDGQIIEAKPPFNVHNKAHMATHCFVDKRMPLETSDYNFLQRNKCVIASEMYINDYLMNGGEVNLEKLAIRM